MDRTHVHTLVVGAGFGGLCTAISFQEGGEPDFLVLERAGDLGGTWRDNTYPGAACDVPSQLYSFSFAPNPRWTRSFSAQPEIQAYLRRTAEEYGVLDRFRFDTEVLQARWDDAACRWRVATSGGDLTADVLVSAAGALSDPRLPDLEGLDSFGGEVFHSARWRHDVDLADRRVAVIGTGASAIQIVPEIAPVVRHLDVYQRSAPYVIPRGDRAYTRLERSAFRLLPALQRAYRAGIYWGREALVPGFVADPRLAAPGRVAALANIRRGISDPGLRRRVRPAYAIGCKRILVSNDWYPALARDDVDLVTDPIVEVVPEGILTRDSTGRRTLRAADVLVVATGFRASDPPIAHRVVGRDGRTMAEHFAEQGMAAYKGATVHGFPNFFFVVGPNTGLGHSSMVLMIEAQVGYAVDALRTMRAADVTAVEPAPTAQQAWNDDLQHRMRRTVWTTGGCSSWYLDAHGRNVTLWPRTTYTFRRLTARFDTEAYTAVRTPDGGADLVRSLEDKVVAITGAGSGLGRALAVRAADLGASLALSDRDGVGLAETAGLARARTSREVRTDLLDVRDREAVHAWATSVREECGQVNMIVNNAGVALHGDLEEVSYEDFEWVMDVDFWGVVHGTKAFLPHLVASGDGHVVNISSLFGLLSVAGQTAYSSAKFAVRGFTEALRQEMITAGHPVQVTCVHPGGIATAIARNARTTASHDPAEVARHFDTRLARTSPERAAEVILAGVLRNRPRVLVGTDATLLDLVVRLTGARYQRALTIARRSGVA